MSFFIYPKYLLVLSLILIILFPSPIYCLPEGESVLSGQAGFDRTQANTLNINTPSDKLIVNYNSFSISQGEAVHFNQPCSNAIALNRVVGVNPSSIMGTLTANGRIFLVNPNGVLFGPCSKVDVAGLIAGTLNISDSDFLKGNYSFYKDGKNAYILNQGQITANPGGYVCLLSQAIENQGQIQADLGTVVFASGEKMTLSLDDLGEISVVIDEPVKEQIFGVNGQRLDSAIKNKGTVSADDGTVILTAKVLNNVFDYAINNQGVTEARSLVNHNGVVELIAQGAPILNTGEISGGMIKVGDKDSDFINQGEIIAEAVKIKIEDKVINKGKIITDGNKERVDGGRISIEADTILQQGHILANAYEGGIAGEISIVSQTSTTLDAGSITEARALGLKGEGGIILIDSLKGNTIVNKSALVDVSSGSIAGNAGFIEVSAFDSLCFYGTLLGSAPREFQGAIIVIDPHSSTIGPSEFGNNTTTYYYTEDDLTITGDISLGKNASLYILADHGSQTPGDWDIGNPGEGAIINSGAWRICGGSSGSRTLYLYAGEGIGTESSPILTENITDLTAVLNPNLGSGGIYINQSGTRVLNINSAFTRDGDIEIGSTGSMEIDGKISADNRAVTLTASEIDITIDVEDAIRADNINLKPATSDRDIRIAGAASDFSITDSDLDRLASLGTVTIGRSDSTAEITLGGINLSDSGPQCENENYSLSILGGKAAITSSVTLKANKSIAITTNGELTVNAGGSITTSGTGTVALTVGGLDNTLTLAGDVLSEGGSIYTADKMSLAGTTNSGSNNTILKQKTNGHQIMLGGLDADGILGLTNTELNRITACQINIGDENSGNIAITSSISPANTSRLYLNTKGAIIDDNISENDITVSMLTLLGSSGIGTSTNPLDTQVEILEASTFTGGVYIIEADDLKLNLINANNSDVKLIAGGSIWDNDLGSAPLDYDIKGKDITLNVGPWGVIGQAGLGNEIDLWYSGTLVENILPNSPLGLDSTPLRETWSNNSVSVLWTGPDDPNYYTCKGIDGYYIVWDNNPATEPTANDTKIGVVTFATNNLLSDSDNHWFHIRALDKAGNLSFTQHFGPFYIDKIPPTISVTSTPLPNTNAWNNSDVSVSYAVNDNLSDIDDNNPLTDYSIDVLSTEGANQSVKCTVIDKAGNSMSLTETINLDKTPPLLTIASPSEGNYSIPQTLTYTVSDNLDIDLDILGPANGTTYNVGTHNILIIATDLAGNIGTATVSFTISPLTEFFSQSANVLDTIPSSPIFLLPSIEQVGGYQLNSFDPIGLVYLYRPLTEIDTTSFERVSEDYTYEFKDGNIEIVGR